MTSHREIRRKITNTEAEIADLQERLSVATGYLKALNEWHKSASKDIPKNGPDGLRPGSSIEKARKAIQEAGRPLRIEEILKELGKADTKKNRLSIGSSLAGYVRRGCVFTRPAPNTFGIKELADGSEEGPPGGFGQN